MTPEMNGGDRRPIPDPSTLTTQALNEAIDDLTEKVNVQFAQVNKLMDVQDLHRKELKQDAKDALNAAMSAAQDAIQAAIAAAKEAGIKAETHFAKEIDALNKQIDEFRITMSGRLEDNKERINDVRSTVDGLMARQRGGVDSVSERRAGVASVGVLVGIVGGALSIVIIIVTLIVTSQ